MYGASRVGQPETVNGTTFYWYGKKALVSFIPQRYDQKTAPQVFYPIFQQRKSVICRKSD
jgi:hypothetical protein